MYVAASRWADRILAAASSLSRVIARNTFIIHVKPSGTAFSYSPAQTRRERLLFRSLALAATSHTTPTAIAYAMRVRRWTDVALQEATQWHYLSSGLHVFFFLPLASAFDNSTCRYLFLFVQNILPFLLLHFRRLFRLFLFKCLTRPEHDSGTNFPVSIKSLFCILRTNDSRQNLTA